MIDKAERTVLGLIKRRVYFDGLTRREVPEYPEFAIREAIRNAVAQRGYTARGSHVDVRLFADRLEVRNPGGLFGDLTVETLDEVPPSTRNPRDSKRINPVAWSSRCKYMGVSDNGLPFSCPKPRSMMYSLR